MLVGKTKSKLIDNLYLALTKYAPERNMINKIIDILKVRNIKNASQLVGKMIPLEAQNTEIIYCLAHAIYSVTHENNVNPKEFFTKLEIDQMKDFKLEVKDVIKFPIILENVVELANNQWSTVMTIQEITCWYNSNMINYNFDTQRNEKYIVNNDGDVIKKPNVNWNSVDDIYEKLISGLFHSNYITLNVLVNGEDNIVYDEDNKALIIKSGQIDILDGFHRSLAMIKAITTNRNLKYKTGIMITNFNVQAANDFIRQEDKRNKIDERHIKSKNEENLMNGIVTAINTNVKSDMRGKIATDIILIQKHKAYTLNDIILDTLEIAFKEVVKTRRDVNKISEYLINFFNEIYGIKYNDFENLEQSRKSNMVTHQNMFVFYTVLAKQLFEQFDWKAKLETLIESMDFSMNNSIWKDIGLKSQNIKINRRTIKKINNYIKDLI